MPLVCEYIAEMPSNMETGTIPFRDRIIKSADTHARLNVKSHDFPDFTADYDTQGELIFKKATVFKPDAFDADPAAAGQNKKPSGAYASQGEGQGGASLAENKNLAIRRLLNQVQQAIVSMEGIAREVDREMERTVGLLALGLAEIMVNHTAESSPDVLIGSLTGALQKGQGQTIRKIQLHPADIDSAAPSREYLSSLVERMQDFRLEPDVTLSRGGCVVETDCGIIDATSANQFRVLMDAFKSVLPSDLAE